MQGCKNIIFSFIVGTFLLLQGCAAHFAYLYDQGEQYYSYQQYQRAFINFSFLARNGDPESQYALGYLYYYGLGTVEDQMKAEYWFNQAALQGQPLAITALQRIDKSRYFANQRPFKIVTIY